MKRIQALSKRTKGIHTLLDIGTDHGYLLIDALKNNHIKKGIAADINDQPLNNARINIEKAGLSKDVIFRLSDGFKQIDLDYDGVVIAGMGMHLVKSILMQPHKEPKKYIVSVHTHIDQFRHFLSSSGFTIVDEDVVFEKFYYIIFTLIKKVTHLTDNEVYLGPFLKHKYEALPYYQHLLKINEKISKSAPKEKVEYLDVQNKWLKTAIQQLNVSKNDW